jgi:hypothetical protein
MTAEQLIARVFYTRNHAHIEHWTTKSYARHSALGDFYADVVGLLDTFVEAHIGLGSELASIPEHKGTQDIVKCLSDDAAWIAKNRSKIAENVEALENILDEITALYLKTLYKLKNLK